jgi:opacity protein-like surface antigen
VLDPERIVIEDTVLRGGADADVVFAWQAFAGLRYRINESMGVSLEYRYFAAGRPTWKADFTVGTMSDRVRFGEAETHAVSVAFEYRF